MFEKREPKLLVYRFQATAYPSRISAYRGTKKDNFRPRSFARWILLTPHCYKFLCTSVKLPYTLCSEYVGAWDTVQRDADPSLLTKRRFLVINIYSKVGKKHMWRLIYTKYTILLNDLKRSYAIKSSTTTWPSVCMHCILLSIDSSKPVKIIIQRHFRLENWYLPCYFLSHRLLWYCDL